MKYFTAIIFLLFLTPLKAVDLFGIQLQDASRNQLRNAVLKSGIRLISEAGDEDSYDIYNSEPLLLNSSRLYLGFVKKDEKFAFAEYEFNGLKQQEMLQKLIAKYGKAEKSNGKYLTDASWKWQQNSIIISLKTDWHNYKTRLTYQNPAALKQFKQERQAYLAEVNRQRGIFQELAY